MRRTFINALALLVIACGSHAAARGPAGDSRLQVNKCEGGGQVCYCSGACSADRLGCHCI